MTQKEKKQLMIIIFVLVPIFVFSVINSIKKVKQKTKKTKAKKKVNKAVVKNVKVKTAAKVVTAVPKKKIMVKITEKERKAQIEIAKSEWGEDPFFHMSENQEQDQPEQQNKTDESQGISGIDFETNQQNEREEKKTVKDVFKLTGISSIGKKLIAVINRKIVSKGDEISSDGFDMIVSDIYEDRVILKDKRGGAYELGLEK